MAQLLIEGVNTNKRLKGISFKVDIAFNGVTSERERQFYKEVISRIQVPLIDLLNEFDLQVTSFDESEKDELYTTGLAS